MNLSLSKTDLRFSFRSLALAVCALSLSAVAPGWADAASEFAAFSSFKDLKLDALAGGAVKATRGPAMAFPRGIAIETCYFVKKPLARTAELHQKWSPSRHSDLKVFLHSDVSAHPSAGDFGKLASAPGNGAVKAFAAVTRKLPGTRADLQMSNAEAKAFPGDAASGGMSPAVATYWGNVLHQRAQAFLAGGFGRLPAYEMGGESIRPADEVARLLKESGKMRGQFAGLIEATPLGGGKGSISPQPYWEMIDVEGLGALTLGALYAKPGANTWQSVDVQYYASGGFYVLVTLQQLWPATIGGQEGTLVWRGDLLSAASLGTLRGVERMGSGTAMMRETQKSIAAFLADIAKAP